MALPQNAITPVAVVAPFLEPDASDDEDIQSLESGGFAISNTTEDRLFQTWRAFIDGSNANISPLSGSPVTTFVTATGLDLVSVGFDSNMNPALAYRENGIIKFKWFNTLTGVFQTDSYPFATSCRVSTDDKRAAQTAASDVIFAYVEAGTLYYRQQRDRYAVRYEVGPAPGLTLIRLGMTENNRFTFELVSE